MLHLVPVTPGRGDDGSESESSSRSSPVAFSVSQLAVSQTLALRRAVLGAPGDPEPLELAGDADPTTVSFAALDPEGEVVSVVRVSAEPPPFMPEHATAPTWRIRGMATRADARNRGIGSAVLGAALAYVASQGGGLVWCNARIPALSLYRRAGFATFGEPWSDPTRGPHVAMWLAVAPA